VALTGRVLLTPCRYLMRCCFPSQMDEKMALRWLEEMEAWSLAYEEIHMVPTATNGQLAGMADSNHNEASARMKKCVYPSPCGIRNIVIDVAKRKVQHHTGPAYPDAVLYCLQGVQAVPLPRERIPRWTSMRRLCRLWMLSIFASHGATFSRPAS